MSCGACAVARQLLLNTLLIADKALNTALLGDPNATLSARAARARLAGSKPAAAFLRRAHLDRQPVLRPWRPLHVGDRRRSLNRRRDLALVAPSRGFHAVIDRIRLTLLRLTGLLLGIAACSGAAAQTVGTSGCWTGSAFQDCTTLSHGDLNLGTQYAVQQGIAGALAGVGIPSMPAKMPKWVYIGGVLPGYANLATAANIPQLLGSGAIGLYQHGNGNASLSPAQRTALWQTWAGTGVTATGQGQSVGEVGEFNPVDAGYLSYFGGQYPLEVNMNVTVSGSYTAGAGDAHPGQVYGGQVSASDQAAIETATTAAIGAGARTVAYFLTPNGGTEDLDDPFATAPFWAPGRTLALFGGGLALDVPPSYWVARGAAYQSMVSQMVAWDNAHHLRTSFVLSPYALSPDAAGNSGNCGRDPNFEANARVVVAYLQAAGTMPTQWIVEPYGPVGTGCGTENDIGVDGTPNSINSVALFLARTTTLAETATAAPGVAGGAADAGLMDTAVLVTPVRAGLPLLAKGPIRPRRHTGPGRPRHPIQLAHPDHRRLDRRRAIRGHRHDRHPAADRGDGQPR